MALTRPERRDLHEVVHRLVGALVAARELAGQRQVALDELLARSGGSPGLWAQAGEEEAFLPGAVGVVHAMAWRESEARRRGLGRECGREAGFRPCEAHERSIGA